MRDYRAAATGGDLYADAPAAIAKRWLAMADGLAALSAQGDTGIAGQLAHRVQDLGLTFRIAGDAEERAWPLTPMPLIVGSAEWAGVERGLIQRAELFDRLAADIYGPREMVSAGHLPAPVVAGSRYFARKMMGLRPRNGHYLHVYAADLARGPRGQWRILSDRLRLATGIGYALENRLALSRATGTLLGDIQARRLGGFFAGLREGIARDCARDNPRIALLTPGRFNQSYPEQAHLARYLGLPLVEGRDLTVADDKLYVRTIAGPRRIDAVWRWIDTDALDPLSFDSRSRIGVPDLFDAWARGGLEMANWPGVEVLESRAFSAFLPRLCPLLMGEEPLLPNVATWWCGQEKEAHDVIERFDELLVAPSFGYPVEGLPGTSGRAGAELDRPERETLIAAIRRRPMDYCGQEIVHLSTTPALIGADEGGGALVPRPFMLRAFVVRGSDGAWSVMPGGFARLSSSGELLTSLMGEGDLSADVCIVDDDPPASNFAVSSTARPGAASGAGANAAEVPAVRRGGGILASQAADNLFWFGRYTERAEMTVRIVRSILGSSIEVDGGASPDSQLRRRLVDLLVQWGAIGPRAAKGSLAGICAAVLSEQALPGGVASLIGQAQQVGMGLRERFARDFWRIAKRRPPVFDPDHQAEAIGNAAKELIEHFAALSGLIAENMVRGDAFRFLDIGRRLERAIATCRIARQLGCGNQAGDALSLLLDLCDSQIAYRSRYLSGPLRDPVFDLVLLDPENPRSLAFQAVAIERHIASLPTLSEDQMPERPLRAARRILGPLQGLTVDMLDDDRLGDIEEALLLLSDRISERYFLQYESPGGQAGNLLA